MGMDPLSFLNVDDPRMRQATFSGLTGQKAQLMERYTKPKQSVGAAAVEGAIGGAIAGGQMYASLSGLDKDTTIPDTKVDSSAIKEARIPSKYDTESIPSSEAEPGMPTPFANKEQPIESVSRTPGALMAGGASSEEYNQKWGNLSAGSFLSKILG